MSYLFALLYLNIKDKEYIADSLQLYLKTFAFALFLFDTGSFMVVGRLLTSSSCA